MARISERADNEMRRTRWSALSSASLRGAQEVAEMNQIFIFMELATAGELFGRVVENGKLEEHEAVRYFSEVASAVGYLHEQGVVHRDLKLENVLLTADAHVKYSMVGAAVCGSDGAAVGGSVGP